MSPRTAAAIGEKAVLTPRSPIELTLINQHEPQVYYRTVKGLYVRDDFIERVVSKAEPSAAGSTFRLKVFRLDKGATDWQIESGLPEDHFFNESQVCAIIAELIDMQPHGQSGYLQNVLCSNLFYLRSYIVRVGRDLGEWTVCALERRPGKWIKGGRVFCLAI